MSRENPARKFHLKENDQDTFDYDFNGDEIKMLDERRQSRLTGKSKTYSWEEAKEIITGKK
jgi:hypothetical protein